MRSIVLLLPHSLDPITRNIVKNLSMSLLILFLQQDVLFRKFIIFYIRVVLYILRLN